MLPRWAGLLLIVGGPLMPFTFPLPQIVDNFGGVLFGAGYVWLGYAVWSNASEPALQPRQPQEAM